MSQMVKQTRRNRERVNVTIPQTVKDIATKNGWNMSKILEQAILSRIKKSGPEGIRTPDLRHVRVFEKSESCTNDLLENQDISLNLDKNTQLETLKKETQNPRGCLCTYLDDPEFKHKYLNFCERTGTNNERTRRGYYSGLESLVPLTTPRDLSDYSENNGKNITSSERKGLLKLFKYLEIKEMITVLNNYPIQLWRVNLNLAEMTKGTRSNGRLKDLTDDEIYDGLYSIEPAFRDYYLLMAYSGARHSQLYEALSKPREIIHVSDTVIKIDVRGLSQGKKNAYYFYFPSEMEEILINYKHTGCIYNLSKDISSETPKGRKINPAGLRKWHYTLMRSGDVCIDSTAADHIQGRSPKGISDIHYLDLDKMSDEGYCRIVSKLTRVFCIPHLKQTATTADKACN